jgi:hypothetical protein
MNVPEIKVDRSDPAPAIDEFRVSPSEQVDVSKIGTKMTS